MSTTAILTQPISAEVKADGRLLRADPDLIRLQFAAGGEEGGTLAVPGLLALARDTARLRMALARTILVADTENCSEYWVESRWSGEIVHLSILSARTIDAIDGQDASRIDAVDQLAGYFQADVNAGLVLLSVTGNFPPNFDHQYVGSPVSSFLKLTDEQQAEWEQAGKSERAFSFHNTEIFALPGYFRMDARPQFSQQSTLDGYRLHFSPVDDDNQAASEELTSTSGNQSILFGSQLAPVLRQPLGRIIANAETIGVKLQGPLRDNYATYAKDIANAAKHLVELVDDLGDLEAIERADFKTAPDRIELGDVARRVAGLLALKAADHQIEIAAPDIDQHVHATAEFRRVLQILLNLVNNAIRYSPDGSKVRIDIATLDGTACITVSDQGDGIDDEAKEKVFEKFERLGRSGDGGSGLGLYISRRLANAMDGALVVSNTAEGGACFALTLPAAT